MAYQGRGAWSSVGGTLKYSKLLKRTVAGPYYMASVNSPMMGLKIYKQLKAGTQPDLNEYVVFLAIKEIQKRLNVMMDGLNLDVDGLLGPLTDAIIKKLQTAYNLEPDGLIGEKTSTILVLPELKRICALQKVDWTVLAGITKKESTFDLGAVGFYDSNDIGLNQINGKSNVLSVEDRVDITKAITNACVRYKTSLAVFGGNIRDAVASYNLGVTGTFAWIGAGRPSTWTPMGQSVSRNPNEYVDDILGAF